MYHNHMRSAIIPPAVSLSIACLLLVAFAIQYPLSSSFPIGGDAADYVEAARVIDGERGTLDEALSRLRSSWYPATHLIFTMSTLLPVSWPDRFMWWMAAGHIATGLALGTLMFRLGRWPAAATAIIFWAITTTGGGARHFEDATLAQLWSLAILGLFIERLAARSAFGAAIALALIPLFHPITGLVALLAVLTTLPTQWLAISKHSRNEKMQLTALSTVAIAQLTVALFHYQKIWSVISPEGNGQPLINIFVSGLSFVMLLSPFGFLALPKLNTTTTAKYFLASLYGTSLLLSGNDMMGIDIWTDRLRSIYVFTAIPLASLGMTILLRRLSPSPLLRFAITVFLFTAIATPAWVSAAHIYAYYNDPKNYARLHPQEYEAIRWIEENIKEKSTITTGISNRHTEWIPALTIHTWLPVANINDYSLIAPAQKGEYIVYFTAREDISQAAVVDPRFTRIYQNDKAAIYALPH